MEFSFWQILLTVAVIALVVWPAARILGKAGFSGWWCILMFVPLANIVMYWVFAFVRWPRVDPAPAAGGPAAP